MIRAHVGLLLASADAIRAMIGIKIAAWNQQLTPCNPE